MARRKPSRWSLGASARVGAASLAALALASCGSADIHPTARTLGKSGEQRLLSLISRAHGDVSAGDGAGADAALTQFVSAVKTLRGSGHLSRATATTLDRRALAAEAAAQKLTPSTTTAAASPTTTPAATATTTAPVPPPQPPDQNHTPGNPHASYGYGQLKFGYGPSSGNQPQGPPGQAKHHGHGHGHGDSYGPGQGDNGGDGNSGD